MDQPVVSPIGPRPRHRGGLAGWSALAMAFLLAACGPGATGSPPAGTGTPGTATDAPTDPPTAWVPDGPIDMIVPFTEGGPTDTVTRLIAGPMGAVLGQEIVVQNVTGAGGTVGAGQAAEADGDGYTILMHHIGMATAPALYANLGYDPLVDFKTIGLVTEVPMTIIGRPDFEPTTLEELVAYVQANADAVTYAHAGVGAASHLCGLLFQDAVETKVTEVPYEGTADALEDLLGSQVDFLCDQTTNTTQHILAGTVKAYGITTAERNDALPDVPTTTEGGLADVSVTVWHGLYVPADTPDDIVAALTAALQVALTDQTVIDELAKLGAKPVAEADATPEGHTAKLQAETELWADVIEAAGITPQ
jgi:tripartite-type tricarboxylate transporter receptor subunit TctC